MFGWGNGTSRVVSERNLTFDDVWSRRELDTQTISSVCGWARGPRSSQSNWRNPFTPRKSPPHLGVDDAMSAASGVRVGIFLP